MSVVRINKNKNYTTMSNYHLQDKNLSLKAKGLLSVMLSLPEEWNYTVEGLVSICKENETAINSTLRELKETNYLVVKKLLPNESKSGRIEYIYEIYETPKQEGKKQDLELLGVEFLGVENQGQLNTKELNTNNIKESIINNNTKEKSTKFQKPTLEELQTYINEKGYHFSAEAFIDYYDSVGWKIGNHPMRSWTSACNTWERKYKENNSNNNPYSRQKEISKETAYPNQKNKGYI